MGYFLVYWQDTGRLPKKGGTKVGESSAKEDNGQDMGIPYTGGGGGRGYGGFGHTVGGDLLLSPPEYGLTIYCNQAHYEPVSGDGQMPGEKGFKDVVQE